MNTKFDMDEEVCWITYTDASEMTSKCPACQGLRYVLMKDNNYYNCPKCRGEGGDFTVRTRTWRVEKGVIIGITYKAEKEYGDNVEFEELLVQKVFPGGAYDGDEYRMKSFDVFKLEDEEIAQKKVEDINNGKVYDA